MGYLTILVFLAVVVSAHCTGCIWLAVPSLAYEGYKYEYPSNTRSSRQGSGIRARSPGKAPLPIIRSNRIDGGPAGYRADRQKPLSSLHGR